MGIVNWIKNHWQVGKGKEMICPKCGAGHISKGKLHSNILIKENVLYCNECKYPVGKKWLI